MARLLRGWDSRGEPTLSERLAAALVDLIDQGELTAGLRLPSERRLAETLGVSRGTVTTAYAELRVGRWLDSRPGSGFRVMSIRGRPAADRTQIDGRLGTVSQTAALDLTSGTLAALPSTLELVLAAVHDRLPPLLADTGYQPQGLVGLREAVASYYCALGAVTESAEVAITTGSQQALQLLADAFVAPGDVVLVEEATYRGAIEIFHARGAKLVPIPISAVGPDLRALRHLVNRLRPRIVYMLPIAHNPTGYVLSPSRAAAVAEILSSSQAIFLEDGSPAELLHDQSLLPTPVGAGVPADRWVAISSISKLFWGGLRVGWIRASSGIIERITRIKTATDLGGSIVSQAIAIECLGAVEAARAERRAQLLASLEAAETMLRELAPEWSWPHPQGGSALWVQVPDIDTRALTTAVRRQGVAVLPGPFFSPVDGLADRMRVPFWGDVERLRAGLMSLVDAWREQRSAG